MANSNGWGDGASNNSIGWGQGAVNNNIGWGDSHFKSWAGLTDIIGSIIVPIVSNFSSRVTTDGGTIEAESCLNAQLTALNNIA
jgi:hypothetical protein